jgi:hypothetical protein
MTQGNRLRVYAIYTATTSTTTCNFVQDAISPAEGKCPRNRLTGHPVLPSVTIRNATQPKRDDSARHTDPYFLAGETLVTRTGPLLPASAPSSPPMYLVPPAKFGRARQDAPHHLDTPTGQLTGHPPIGQPQHPPRTLRVLLDDPAAAALSLRAHMQPADLQELLLILATAAADGLRDRQNSGRPPPPDLSARRPSIIE